MWLRNGPTTIDVSDQGGMIRGWWHLINGVQVPIFNPQEPVGEKLRGGAFVAFPSEVSVPRFGVPKHGWLRDMAPSPFAPMSGDPCGTVVEYFYYHEGTPLFPWPCLLRVGVYLEEDGFGWELYVSRRQKDGVSSTAEGAVIPMPLCPAFHPFFFSPYGSALVSFRGGGKAVVSGQELDQGPLAVPEGRMTALVRGLGTLIMTFEEGFGPDAVAWVWRDCENYFVVEPYPAHPDMFGTDQGLLLGPEQCLTFRIGLRFRPEQSL